MLPLSKKTEYAILALAYLARRAGKTVSARQMAQAYGLPLAMLMNVLKVLHHEGLLHSERGVKGGYRLAADPGAVTLYDLMRSVDGPSRSDRIIGTAGDRAFLSPIRTLQSRLVDFLKNIKLSMLVTPEEAGG